MRAPRQLSLLLLLSLSACKETAPAPEAAKAKSAATAAAAPAPPSAAAPTQPSASAPAAPAPAPSAPSTAASKGHFLVVGVAENDVLHVRAEPSAEAASVLALAPDALGVNVVGKERNVTGSRWSEVEVGTTRGWVNRRFLAEQHGNAAPALRAADLRVVEALARRDLASLSSLLGPDGLRLSPYGHVTKTDLVVTAKELPQLFRETKLRHWGEYDGSGEPIDLAFSAYFDKFVNDAAFAAAPVVGLGVRVAGGNTLDNLAEFYPGSVVIEHYFPATDESGMNWRALRLVFQEKAGKWQLLGIAHVAWTI